MKLETVDFKNGTYEKSCDFFQDIKIGSINCVGHSKMASVKKCQYYVSHKEDNFYYLEFMKETISISSEVLCNRPGAQLLIF